MYGVHPIILLESSAPSSNWPTFSVEISGMYYNYITPRWLLYTVTAYVFKLKMSYTSIQNFRSFPGAHVGRKGRPYGTHRTLPPML